MDPDVTLAELTARLARAGAALAVHTLAGGLAGLPPAREQIGDATYAAKLERFELEVDWQRDATYIARLTRLERAWTVFRGKRMVIKEAIAAPGSQADVRPGTVDSSSGHLVVQAGSGRIELMSLQMEGRATLGATEWLRGARIIP
ncbi:protein containing Formyl transferase, partial [mine drainage metagenome]